MREFLVTVPEDVKIKVEKEGYFLKVVVEGKKGKSEKLFKDPTLSIEIKDGKVEVYSDNKAMINTVKRHILNLIKGVREGFTKKMVVRYSHFPIKVEVKGKEIIIKNFLGERAPRKAKIFGDAKVTVKGSDIIIEGTNIEHVSQTAANIRQAVKIKNKDIRVFQDGIYPVIE